MVQFYLNAISSITRDSLVELQISQISIFNCQIQLSQEIWPQKMDM